MAGNALSRAMSGSARHPNTDSAPPCPFPVRSRPFRSVRDIKFKSLPVAPDVPYKFASVAMGPLLPARKGTNERWPSRSQPGGRAIADRSLCCTRDRLSCPSSVSSWRRATVIFSVPPRSTGVYRARHGRVSNSWAFIATWDNRDNAAIRLGPDRPGIRISTVPAQMAREIPRTSRGRAMAGRETAVPVLRVKPEDDDNHEKNSHVSWDHTGWRRFHAAGGHPAKE